MPRILVVDDDAAIRETWDDLLWSQGYEVEAVSEGREALTRLETQAFDLMLLDVLLPHLNGFAVMERLRMHASLRELPVILVSGLYQASHHRAEMMARFQIADYLDKPVPASVLLAAVERAVGPGEAAATTERPSVSAPAVSSPSVAHLVDDDARAEHAEVEADAKRSFGASPFSLQGSLAKTPVAQVLGRLWRQRASGALLLRREAAKKIVYVRDGTVYHVKSNLVGECLGHMLVHEHLISESDCEASIAQMKRSRKQQGEVLVAMGALTERNLAFALGLQLETKLFDTFAWPQGAFRFNSSAPLPKAERVLDLEGAAIVVEGVRRVMDETRLRTLMRPVLDVPLDWTRAEASGEALGLEETQRQALRSMHLPESTRVLLSKLPLAPAESLRLVYTLIALESLKPAAV